MAWRAFSALSTGPVQALDNVSTSESAGAVRDEATEVGGGRSAEKVGCSVQCGADRPRRAGRSYTVELCSRSEKGLAVIAAASWADGRKKTPRWRGFPAGVGCNSEKKGRPGCCKPGLPHPQKRAGARLRSRSSSGQADMIAVVFILENSCDVPTTRSLPAWLTAFRKKMQPKWKRFFRPENCKIDSASFKPSQMKKLETSAIVYRVLHFRRWRWPKVLRVPRKFPASVLPAGRSRHGRP